MKISFNPSNSNKNILDLIKNNKDIIFDLKGHSIFARGVEFKGTDTNTWRPVVDNLTSDSTTSSLSAKQGKVLKALIDGKSNSDHNHDGRYLKLTGGTMASNALITFADSGSWDTSKKPQGARGGLYWTGQSDYAKLYAEETVGDNLDLVIQFGDDNSNGLSIRNKANTQTSYISAGGVITTGTFKGNLDWSYITNKPASYTPSAHTHAWNSLTHSSTTENQAILTNGKANGWKLYTLNISRWDNAANNAHSHANKSVLDGITSALVNSWNTAYNFVSNITGTDTDKVINKWEEIVNFLAGITEDNKLNTLLNSKLSIQQLSAKDILTTKTNNALFWVDTKGNASTITTGPFTDHPYALLSVTNYNQNAENHKFFYRSRLAFSSAGDIKVASCHHEYEYQQDETWYNVLTSKNSGINGSTIKLNGTSITVYSSGTADGRYVKKSGDTMQGVLTIDTTNFGALTIKRNDDANGASIQFRGKSSVYGYIGLNNSTKDKQFLRWSSDISRVYTILDTSSTYISNGKGVINGTTITQVDNATNSTNSTNARKLVNWYSARPTSLNAQFGDGSLRIFYATSSTTEGKPAEDSHILHLAWDNTGGWDAQLAVHACSGKVSTRAQNGGTWQPWKTLAFTTDIPSSLKNPYSFNVFGVVYDGSAAKTVTTSNFISQVNEGTSTITDGTMLITSYATNSGFADTNAVNVPYKRKAIHLWEYIKTKTDSLYATKGHNHDGRYVRAFGTSNDNIDSDWGQSFKTFDPIPLGTPPEKNPNISLLSIGENFNRRKQLAFIWNNDNIYYRRRIDGSFTNWRRLAFTDSKVADSDKLDGIHANGLLTALSNSNNGISITVGGTTKSISNINVNYAASAGNANTLDGIDSTRFLRQVVVPNNTENDFNTFSNMTLTGRVDPTTGASLKNAPWSGSGPAGGYGVLTYLFNGSGYGTQMAWGYSDNRIYIRNRYWGGSGVGPVWRTSWDTLALTSDIPTVTNYYWANVKISASSSTTTSPTVHTLTATRVCAGHNPGIDNSISCSNWFRSSGNTGWYNTTYQGGWYMSDTSWIRAHNGVGIYTSGQIYSSSSIRMGSICLERTSEINSSDNLLINYRSSADVDLCQGGGNVGIGTNTPTQKLDVHGNIRATGQIIREGSGQPWVTGRNGALLRETSAVGYHTLWSLKTTNGSWDFGEHNSSGWNNIPVLSYITDSNYNSGNNATTYQIKFPLASGTVALTSDISNYVVIGKISNTQTNYEIQCNTNITYNTSKMGSIYSLEITFNNITVYSNEINNYILFITNFFTGDDNSYTFGTSQNKLRLIIDIYGSPYLNVNFIVYKCKEGLIKYTAPFPR